MNKTRTYNQFINDFQLNNTHADNIDILSEHTYVKMQDRMLCKCKVDDYEWSVSAYSLLHKNSGCIKCAGLIKKTHEEFLNEICQINDKIIVLGTYVNRKAPIEFKCDICGYIWKTSPSHVLCGSGCPCCSNNVTVVGINDMWTTASKIAKLLLNCEDGYKYTKYSGMRTNWKCSNCGNILCNKAIKDVTTHGLRCNLCSDGISIPEKFMSNILNHLNINYEYNKKLFNIDRKYDFYINEFNAIIETHGLQHYEEITAWTKLDEIQANDLYKENLAKENGIDKYIVIDCRYSELDWMKASVLNSELSVMYDLSSINWEQCYKNSFKSRVIEVCNLYNVGMKVKDVCEQYKLSSTTVRKYINRGISVGICISRQNK